MMGAIGTGNVAAGPRHRQPRHLRHDLRLQRQTGHRSRRRSRRLLRQHRRVAPAGLHDERHRGDRGRAQSLRLVPRAAGRSHPHRPARRRRPPFPPLPAGRAHAQPARRHRRLPRPHHPHHDARAPGPRHDGRRDARPRLRPASHAHARHCARRKSALTGGGSKSAIWRQICADVFGCRVVTLAESEGAALGAAIQALAAAETEQVHRRRGPTNSCKSTPPTPPSPPRPPTSTTSARWRNKSPSPAPCSIAGSCKA